MGKRRRGRGWQENLALAGKLAPIGISLLRALGSGRRRRRRGRGGFNPAPVNAQPIRPIYGRGRQRGGQYIPGYVWPPGNHIM